MPKIKHPISIYNYIYMYVYNIDHIVLTMDCHSCNVTKRMGFIDKIAGNHFLKTYLKEKALGFVCWF